jgi:hypothetical protein
MKKRTLILVTFCWLAGLAVVQLYAQDIAFRAAVPFSFIVLERTFPVGEYTLTVAPHMVKIEDANGAVIATVLANEVPGRSAGATSEIIFHCYRDRCFLSELRSPIPGNGRQLITSPAEAELAKKQPGQYFTLLVEKPRQ